MDEETRTKANSINKKIDDLKEALKKCEDIPGETNHEMSLGRYSYVIVPKELRDSVLMQVECSYKAKLKALEKEFADL